MKKTCLFILILFVSQHTEAQVSNYKLQAVYIFNFAKYIKWTNAPSTFVIGIFGDAEMADFLQSNLQNKKIGNKPLEIKVLNKIEEISQCQLVYLSKSKSKQLSAITDLVDGQEILVVTEEDLAKKGAAISFFVEDNTLKFRLNQRVLTKSGLIASSGLLSLASVINSP
jgi:hypothetical protein